MARTISADQFVAGIHRLVVGIGKKTLIANTVAVAADRIFALPAGELTFGLAWLGAITYTLQIYFDFSGYSDMAIGLGRMLGFEFVENFNYPYVACSVQDFWRRWHMSLSAWLRDYVYIPLGGGRVSLPRIYVNLCWSSFCVGCGMEPVGRSWSGACTTAAAGRRTMGLVKFKPRTAPILGRAYTMLAVMIGWILFRTESVSLTRQFLAANVGLRQGNGKINDIASYATLDVRIAIWPARCWRPHPPRHAPEGEPANGQRQSIVRHAPGHGRERW